MVEPGRLPALLGPGRRELARLLPELERRFALAEGGTCHLVLVTGPAGIGKTRLVEEFERNVAARGRSTRARRST